MCAGALPGLQPQDPVPPGAAPARRFTEKVPGRPIRIDLAPIPAGQKARKSRSEKTATVCIDDWAQEYLDAARVRFTTATYMEKRSMFKHLFKEIDPNLPVSNLKPGDVLAYIIKQKEERSGYAANKDRKNLVAAWNWGMKYMKPPLPGTNPCLVDRMPEERQPRYVPPEEDFWKVYDTAEGQDRLMLLACLHLAARKGEIFRLTWSDVDFGNNSVQLTTRKRKDGSLESTGFP